MLLSIFTVVECANPPAMSKIVSVHDTKGQKENRTLNVLAKMSWTGRPVQDLMSCPRRLGQDIMSWPGRLGQDNRSPIFLVPLRIMTCCHSFLGAKWWTVHSRTTTSHDLTWF